MHQMKGIPIRLFLLCALVAAFALAVPQPADAAQGYERCVNVGEPGERCRECVDMPYWTGACCHQIGDCYCIYVECPSFTAGLPGQTAQEDLLLAAEPAPISRAPAAVPATGPALDEEASVPPAPSNAEAETGKAQPATD